MSKAIIGIHGLANKPPKNDLTKYWIKSIQEGLEKNCDNPNAQFDYEMVYWADRLYKMAMHEDAGFNFDDLYNSEPYLPAPGPLVEYRAGLLDRVRIGGNAAFGATVDFVKNTFGVERVADWVLQRVLKDLDFYYDDDRKIPDRSDPPKLVHARRVLMDELANAVRAQKGKEIMLIAHSMGTIIAFDVLHELADSDPDLKIAEFVTIGAPLGLPHVKTKILQEAGPDDAADALCTPENVTGSWINYWDRRDAVAIDGHLRDDFRANKAGIRVVDDLVDNSYEGTTGAPNYHKSYGYLRAPELSKQINTFLNG